MEICRIGGASIQKKGGCGSLKQHFFSKKMWLAQITFFSKKNFLLIKLGNLTIQNY